MGEQEAVQHWQSGADRMLMAARHAAESGDYEVCLFCLHLAVEKMLKARFIATKSDRPPITHDLVALCAAQDFVLSNEQKDLLTELTTFSAYARYGDESWVSAEATKQNTNSWIQIAEEYVTLFQP